MKQIFVILIAAVFFLVGCTTKNTASDGEQVANALYDLKLKSADDKTVLTKENSNVHIYKKDGVFYALFTIQPEPPKTEETVYKVTSSAGEITKSDVKQVPDFDRSILDGLDSEYEKNDVSFAVE
ncbi:hypothetical protein [Vagococcus acidifermentans]|uniref:DUF4467 domain-containing protein n=1 Tax=Vagococcus acidifermentans TaxID=564710 RepID=A0A430AS35_9ENTE|nr:hypothetical protein [Vagococcus acidifermentans]RSU10866.1 hypothetical protein CBF27_09225 [Vagococcus acidifermentans]